MSKRKIQVLKSFFVVYGLVLAGAAVWCAFWGQDYRLAGGLAALVLSLVPLLRSSAEQVAFWRYAFLCHVLGMVLLCTGADYRYDANGRQATRHIIAIFLFANPLYIWLFPRKYGTELTSLFGAAEQKQPIQELRSTYEAQIREAAGQEERNRLARELHDSIKQQIYAIHTSAAAAQARLATDGPGAQAALEAVRSSAREAMAEMEAMLDSLRATPLESVGLVEAIKKQCEALQYRTQAKVTVDVAGAPETERLAAGAAQSLFRITQEALANIARHARATEVSVSLTSEGDDSVLRIHDNGSGFAGGANRSGMGLANMESRAAEQGGVLTIQSRPGSGTSIIARLPLIPVSAPTTASSMEEDRVSIRTVAGLAMGSVVLAGCSFFVLDSTYAWMMRGMALGLGISAVTVFVHWRTA